MSTLEKVEDVKPIFTVTVPGTEVPQSILEKDLNKEIVLPSRKDTKKKKKDTAGRGWGDMERPEITPELKRDLEMLQLRGYLDPHHPMKAPGKKWPKYFQMGTVIEGPTEFYSSRIPRKLRKKSLADEILAASDVRKNAKRRFGDIQKARSDLGIQRRSRKSKSNVSKRARKKSGK